MSVLSTALSLAVLSLAYASLFALERALPLRQAKARLLPRLFVNVVVSTAAFAVPAALVQSAAAATLVFQLGPLFHHSIVRIPLSIERALNMVLVTPRMHGIHHSDIQDENLKNLGVVFPWWDRLHRTLRLNVPQAQVRIGIPGYSRAEDNAALQALVMPFRPQRDYWEGPQGRQLRREAASSSANARLSA